MNTKPSPTAAMISHKKHQHFRRYVTPSALAWTMLILTLAGWAQSSHGGPTQSKADFEIAVNGRTLPFSINFEPVMPGEKVIFTTSKDLAPKITITINGRPIQRNQKSFIWQASSSPGLNTAEIILTDDKATKVQTIQIALFVMVPADNIKKGYLNGYQIGSYPPPLGNLSAYRAPRGYIEVTPQNATTLVSPNFRLEQFLCKQVADYPKYLVLQPHLLTRLEELLLEVNARGIKTDSFVVMSGYRTPYYNRAIKNVANSYHIYGGAADIYIDVAPKDGRMDDLNKDGKRDRADATYLYDIADTLGRRYTRSELTGGIGEYGANSAHGPFIHIDVRGSRARWGRKD